MSRLRPILALLSVLTALAACGGSRPPRDAGVSGPTGAPQNVPQDLTFDAAPLYRQAGLISRGLPLPFLGRVGYLASPSADLTHTLIALSFGNNALSFTREADDRFRANYTVALAVRRGPEVIAQSEATEEVIVGAFRETVRFDETLIFQQVLDVPPGDYELTVFVRDEGSQRNVQEQLNIRVPRLEAGSFTAPIPIVEVTPRGTLDSLPVLIASPRATVIFGRDSIIPVYVEHYDTLGAPLRLEVRNERGRVLWSDTVSIARRGSISSRVIEVPVSRIGIGIAELALARAGEPPTPGTAVFVGFGEDLPVASFENMLTYLRYFAAPYRLDAMRAAPEEQRPAEWAKFVRETDTQPNTAAHEDLRDYFARIVRANSRFRDETAVGWQSDRGRVYVTLGEPDQVVEPAVQEFQRSRQQVWEYRSQGLQLVFYDQSGTGRWRLTPNSNTRFETEFRRRLR